MVHGESESGGEEFDQRESESLSVITGQAERE
jgi:hypothetical protein